ncbi:hypothetical protein FE784_39310 [Paenibacillus hemerocallicola]|uniref:Uncharacterized protein n=1 Tax=Paenibacillus hemerocallicola TaxID=1172614 RepID=A0A5C4SVI7_9BACL|nr:DUF5696 domain-containing protein [Paenibacillus hemerocallicola]TNJ55717.1 hypothetical protein FE784_39310 [Paenibacillus hemerocallicola]
MTKSRMRLVFALSAAAVVVAATLWLGLQIWSWQKQASTLSKKAAQTGSFAAPGSPLLPPQLPPEERFKPVAESVSLKLLADSATGHFQVIDKSTGYTMRSYPDPQYWSGETLPAGWKNNLLSPIIVEYANISNYKSATKTVGLIGEDGYVEQFQTTPAGFKATFVFGKGQFKIPVEVTLNNRYVETTILDEGIVEGGAFSLLNAKLYPLLGSQPSYGQDGYIFIPDGSGALIRFKPNRIMQQLTYNESIYGSDASFYSENVARQPVTLPVFGLKSGSQGFAAVVTEGAEAANVYAAPSGSVGISNWVTAEWQYRKRFFQSISKSTDEGFFTYGADKFVVPRRTVRYYVLSPQASDYVGMASVYRSYLIDEKQVKPQRPSKDGIPLYVDIIGGDIEKGLLLDKYKTGTTTSEAVQLVRDVHDLGIRNLTVHYTGWQKDGYSTHGDYFPVESKLGGNKGMKSFIDFAHSLNIPVYLTANYSINNVGDGFWPRRDGLRDLAGNVLETRLNHKQEPSSFVSPGFYRKAVASDLSRYESLGADGIYFEDGIGRLLSTDYNGRYYGSRGDAIGIQRDIFRQTNESLGAVAANNVNAFAFDQVTHIPRLADDYSHDIFVDEAVPFAQIVLHGLVGYTSAWSNLRDESRVEFLRSIEYGAYPTYVFASAPSDKLKNAYSVWYYSLNYKDWLDSLAEEYRRSNEALSEVQGKSITGHRTLAPNVKETVYEGSYRIIVNYNASEYVKGSLRVPGQDFAVVRGEAAP